ncbi:carbohydrate ABC transporter membrane protein 2, CUT1 family (TC 3.A.1.1.-) [Caloramator fervidus]|uniref:Carbohydrate ABC transporter membrane protein 2, CUT1 family (TC 3.A.1.1.-) n=1 Tax=Caloramator fervidus TaxID=29344 RepID=A0A1H5VIE7_9CLOT|nr:ABC transporter permease subunit [Caloramator fervidus]SEF87014.1 carbohydrate ABC transporter membrane protein 2, CUT1 family (TC 3.A.1.1.-) [Caloramator fervidus]
MRKSDYFERTDSKIKILFIYITLIIMSLLAIYPVLNILSSSLRPSNQLFSTSLKIIPENASLMNFKTAIFKKPLVRWILNSMIVSFISMFISIVFSATSAYAFSRYKFLGKKSGMIILLVTQMFPAAMLLLPLNILLTNMGLSEKLWALTIPYISSSVPFSIWLLKGYFDTIPTSIEESAYVDGASVLTTFYKIVLPLSKPALAVASIFCFMNSWSEYIVARVLIHDERLYTLPLGLVTLQGQYNTEWGVYSACAILTSIPVMIIFSYLSKYLIGGLTIGSIKE